MTDITESDTAIQAGNKNIDQLFCQLFDLYERHVQDRQWVIKDKEELGRLIQLLITQTKEVGQYEQGIRKRIQDCIQSSSQAAMEKIEKSVTDKNSEVIEKLQQTITNIVVESIATAMNELRVIKKQFPWKIMLFSSAVTLLFSLLIVYFLMPKPMLPLTNAQMHYLQDGKILTQVWPKLSQKEQGHLKSMAADVVYAD
jgi:predicted PurR-regulated permease PerM